MRIQPLLLTTAMLAATATDTTYAQRPRSISGLPSWALDTVGRDPRSVIAAAGCGVPWEILGGRFGADEGMIGEVLAGTGPVVVKSYSEVIDSTTKLYYPNITVLLSRHGVEDIACSAVTCRLPSGIGVGSTLTQVVRALGRGHPGYRSGPSHSLFYYPERCDCWLEVSFDEHQRVFNLSLVNDNS